MIHIYLKTHYSDFQIERIQWRDLLPLNKILNLLQQTHIERVFVVTADVTELFSELLCDATFLQVVK